MANNNPRIAYDVAAQTSGTAEVEQLARSLEKLDEAVDPAAAQRAQRLADELRSLTQQRAAVETFLRALADSNAAGRGLEEAQQAADRLGSRLKAVAEPTRAQAGQLQKLRDAAVAAQLAFTDKTQALNDARSALQRLGIAEADVGATQDRLNASLTRTRVAARELVSGFEQQAAAAKKAAVAQADSTDAIDKGLQAINGRLGALRNLSIGAVLGSQVRQLVGDLASTADAFNNLRARMRLVTGEGEALQQAMSAVQQIAMATGTSLDSTATLFTRVLSAGKEVGLSQAEALRLTETINQAVQVSGASAQSSDAAITQLIQGLQSGVLRGEEFNSVMEQAPRLAQALADGLGVTRGQLRGLAQDGKLSSEQVILALQSQGDALRGEFEKLPLTVGRAVENLRTQYAAFVGQIDASSGFTDKLASGINAVAANLDTVARVAAIAGAALTAELAIKGAAALRAYAVEAAAAAGATNLLTASIARVPSVVNITVAAVGLELGYEIGKLLYENSSAARTLGVAVTEFFAGLVNDLQFLKESAAAIFTDDTLGKAFDRFKARAEAQRDIFREMYKDAETAPEVVRAAAAAARAEMDTLGASAKGAGAAVAAGGATGAAGVGSIGTAAATAEAAIGSLAKAAGVALPAIGTTARQQAAALAEIANKGGEAARKIGELLPEALAKLTGSELSRFREAFVGALRASTDSAQLLQQVLLETGRRAATALGVDLAQGARAVSAEFAAAQENLALMVRSLDTLRASGIDTGAAVEQALRKMADGAKNQAEFDALRNRIEALGKAGQISKAQVLDLLDAVRKRADDATQGVNSLQEALGVFGIKTQAELRKTADTVGEAWARIVNDTTISLADKAKAFDQWSAAAIAANGGVETSEVRLQRIILENRIAAAGLGDTIKLSMNGAKSAIDAAADAQARFNALMQADPTRLVGGNGLGGIGGSGATSAAAPSPAFQSGSSAAQPGGAFVPGAGQSVGTVTEVVDTQGRRGLSPGGFAPAPVGQVQTLGGPIPLGQGATVVVNLPGGGRESINVSDSASAGALVRALDFASRSLPV